MKEKMPFFISMASCIAMVIFVINTWPFYVDGYVIPDDEIETKILLITGVVAIISGSLVWPIGFGIKFLNNPHRYEWYPFKHGRY